MRIFTGMVIGREALMSNGGAIASVADNISNSNTIGYKAGRAQFADILASGAGGIQTFNPIQTGNGSKLSSLQVNLGAGVLESTGRGFDAAIDGSGFFIVSKDGTSASAFTRAGDFRVDDKGRLVTSRGEFVLGYPDAESTTLQALDVGSSSAAAAPTTSIDATGNLDASAEIVAVPANPATFTPLNDTATLSAPYRIIDSLGQAHDISIYFFKTANLQWQVRAYADAGETGGAAGTPALVGQGAINFGPDGSQGVDVVNTMAMNMAWNNGANPSAVNFELGSFKQYSGSSYTSTVVQDGNRAGLVARVEILENGTINAVLNNGDRQPMGLLALAGFANPAALERAGNNSFYQTTSAGALNVGAPQTGGLGKVKQEALEGSNVDMASQFVDMIRYQRGYQAGSQIIQTVNDLVDTTLQIA